MGIGPGGTPNVKGNYMSFEDFHERFMKLAPVEQRRLLNVMKYINDRHPRGAELHDVLQGLHPDARSLLGNMLKYELPEKQEGKDENAPG